MSEALATAPAPAPSPAPDASIDALASLIPDSAILPDPGVAPSPAPAPAENAADASDAAKIEIRAEKPVSEPEEAKAEPPPAEQADTDALERAEQAAKRAREGSRRYREMLEKQQQQAAEVQRAAREAAELRRQAEEAKQLQEYLRKDPYAALKKLGMTDQDLAERALREGTPEALVHKVTEQLEAERQARLALEQRLADREASMARQQAEANFAKVADNATSYPRLAELNPSAQLAVAKAALQQIANNGYEVSGFSDEQVAEACERFLAPKKGARPAPKAATPAQAVKPGGTKTLTNAVATQKAVAQRPWHELSDDEQISAIAAMLPDPT